MRRRLRVGVPEAVRSYNPRVGHGRVWREVLRELEALAKLSFGGARRLDVWLADGHAEVPDTGLPLVVQIHEASWRLPEVEPHFTAEFLDHNERLTGLAASKATRVITASQATKAQIAQRLDLAADVIDVVAHGVALRPAGPSPVAGPYVLFAASVHPRKNLGSLRAALADLADPPPLVLVVSEAADRPDSSALMEQALAPLPGGVRRVEEPDDDELAALMAGCSAFVLPSHWEGFGLTALEAMACGAPVIVSDRGALPEVVGDAGLTCTPDPPALAAALTRVLSDPALAESMRSRGRERASHFTWERTARGWLESLERAAG